MKHRSIGWVVVSITLLGTFSFAAPPILRHSDDRNADLIEALVANQRFEDAESVCRWNLNRHQKSEDEYALAITRLARIIIATQIADGIFDASAVEIANKPIDGLLGEYPDHDRKLFLEAARISIRQMAVQMAVAGAAINVSDQSQTLPTMTRLTRLTRDAESLIDRIRQTAPRNDAILKDHQRLEQELLVATVSMALMQTELFPADSPDAIAASTAAVEAAEQAQLKLPEDSQAAEEIQRMRITAVLRSGDAELAFTELQQLFDRSNPSPSSNLRALQIEVLLALGRTEEAGEILRADYVSSANQSIPSIPMDLARLRYFLATDNTDAAAKWITEVGQRHGLYARRLAESIVISKLDQSLKLSDTTSSSNALIETRGRQLIRDGELADGGRMLARAAESQSDPKLAIEIAITAAAALQKAELFQAGSLVLTKVARTHSAAADAPALNLQAVFMLTSGTSPATGDEIESRLRQHLKIWPESDTSTSARQWLMQRLVAKGDNIDAAVIATSLTPSQINAAAIKDMVEHWRTAFLVADEDDLDAKLSKKAQGAMAALGKHPLVVSAHRQLAACFFDRSSLSALPEIPPSEPPWVEQVLRFRRDGKLAPALRDLTEHVGDVRRRLMKDGQSNPAIRKRIADLLASWLRPPSDVASRGPIEPLGTIEQAVVQLWLGNVAQAAAIVDSQINTNQQAEQLIEAATLFQDSEDKNAKTAAVRWWDQLAAGSELGSPNWHQGKLASIDLLYRSGNREEASRRAKYILLTISNLTADQKSKYESYHP